MTRLVRAACVAAVLACPAVARSEGAPDAARADRALTAYFAGEKVEGWVFAGVGASALGAGAGLFAAGEPLRHGLAAPIAIVGLVELAAGVVLLLRTDAQVSDLRARFREAPERARADELERMKRVQREFVWLERIELAMIAAGIGLATYGGFARAPVTAGLGTGLAAQGAIMLTFDRFASERADAWVSALEGRATPRLSLGGGPSGAGLSFGGSF